jgi:hypothetical protein
MHKRDKKMTKKVLYLTAENAESFFTTKARRKIRQDNRINRDYVFASLVFLAKPAFKASFVAGYCFRPQGHRNGLIQKLAKVIPAKLTTVYSQKSTT